MTKRCISDKVTRFNAEVVSEAINKCGIPKNKLSSMVLGRDQSYISNALAQQKCNKEDLKKLCEFISIDYESVVIEDTPQPKEESKPTVGNNTNVDMLIVGLNKLCEIEAENGEKLDAILEQIKVTNTKTNRLENALGTAVSNIIEIKNTTNDNNSILKDLKSQGAVISGRLRDMVAKFK